MQCCWKTCLLRDLCFILFRFDTPYLSRNVGPEIIASMTAVACSVKKAVKIPFGMYV
jgi:predicted TIM-barrel enzyme